MAVVEDGFGIRIDSLSSVHADELEHGLTFATAQRRRRQTTERTRTVLQVEPIVTDALLGVLHAHGEVPIHQRRQWIVLFVLHRADDVGEDAAVGCCGHYAFFLSFFLVLMSITSAFLDFFFAGLSFGRLRGRSCSGSW